jgi:hypothetical protein
MPFFRLQVLFRRRWRSCGINNPISRCSTFISMESKRVSIWRPSFIAGKFHLYISPPTPTRLRLKRLRQRRLMAFS